jgi:hypothetical protein
VKISEKDKRIRQTYRFFLFSDLLVYAAGQAPRFKVHQALHLSLARIVDHVDTLTHNFISPQKSFAIEYPDAHTKATWQRQLVANIKAQRLAQHQHALDLQTQTNNNNNTTATNPNHSSSGAQSPTDPRSEPRGGRKNKTETREVRTSSLGTPSQPHWQGRGSGEYSTDPSLTSSFFNQGVEQSEAKSSAWVCKLCIRVNSRWTARGTCAVCNDRVCKRCASNTLELKGETVPVCDCCFGVMNGALSASSITTQVTNSNVTSASTLHQSRGALVAGENRTASASKPLPQLPSVVRADGRVSRMV